MTKPTSYVNVFQGNGEINLPKPEGIASTWFFVKAQCGNTFPHAALPFSKMTCGAYSGAYPTGYGTHDANYCGKVGKLYGEKCFCGFSHLHHSGTGAVGYYYNYALTSPFYGDLSSAFSMDRLSDEKAFPGYYTANKGGLVKCEATVTKNGCAIHNYTFKNEGGKIAVDFNNNGLLTKGMRGYASEGKVSLISDNCFTASVKMEGIFLHFAVVASGDLYGVRLFYDDKYRVGESLSFDKAHIGRYGVVCNVGRSLRFTVAYSLKSASHAVSLARDAEKLSFEETAKYADEVWNKYLSAIKIDSDENTKKIFYSNLYHTLLKPANICGESFIYAPESENEAFFTDFTTLWDIYKTQLPLVFALFADEGRQISHTLVRVCEALSHSPNCLTLSDRWNTESTQARSLSSVVLMTAHLCGLDGDAPQRVLSAMLTDILNDRNSDYMQTGLCKLYTHILDLAEACYCTASLASQLNDTAKSERFFSLSNKFSNAYDKSTGLLSDKSAYYEGGLHNYSFRLCHDMEERIAIAGGKERYAALLDSFFGYGKKPITQPTDPDNKEYIDDGIRLGRFEGFNNEPDMETPYSYIYADRHDKTCEIIRAGLHYMFTSGEGGIPGNNDSGGLSSCYIWNVIGLFPEVGHDRILIGSPSVNMVVLHLSSGRDFTVKVYGDDGIYVEKAMLNGRKLEKPMFTLTELMQGGILEVYMKK